MIHLLKTFLKIIHNRIFKLNEEQISETQFGFRSAAGTRESLFRSRCCFSDAGTSTAMDTHVSFIIGRRLIKCDTRK